MYNLTDLLYRYRFINNTVRPSNKVPFFIVSIFDKMKCFSSLLEFYIHIAAINAKTSKCFSCHISFHYLLNIDKSITENRCLSINIKIKKDS